MNNNRQTVLEAVRSTGIVAVVRMEDSSKVLPCCEAILDGGIDCLEITMTVPGALEQIAAVSETFGESVTLGVGSVLDDETIKRSVDAGARYVVSPVYKPGMIKTCHSLDVPIMPGAFTPTEIQDAHENGADVIKVFPAAFFGPKYIKAVKAPLPHLRLMPTGGVSVDNADEWIKAGSFALGVGSSLVDKKAIAESRFSDITDYARALCEKIKAARS